MNKYKPNRKLWSKPMNLGYDDVSIFPGLSDIARGETTVRPKAFNDKCSPAIPLIASCMDSVTELEMIRAMNYLGGLGIHHRYCETAKLIEISNLGKYYPIAIGTIKSSKNSTAITDLIRNDHNFFVIDVAHGAHSAALDTIQFIKSKRKEAIVVAGNVCSMETGKEAFKAGADAIRAGVGTGSACTTRTQIGVGMQIVSTLLELSELKYYYSPGIIIADGGIRNSADVVKAIACGADYVMLGNILAGCDESPGQTLCEYPSTAPSYKIHRGMASYSALVDGNGKSPEDIVVEGTTVKVPLSGPVSKTIKQITESLRQAMFYVGASNLDQFYERSKIGIIR